MTDHAACGPSSAAMWCACPASITLSKGMTRPSSQYAKEGTAAHQVAEMILQGEIFPPPKIKVDGTEFIVAPMYKALHAYIDFVRDLMMKAADWRCEQRVALNDLVWGTTDFAAISGPGRVVDIVDLKYGQGVLVSPQSAQLKIYGLAAIRTLWPDASIHTVRMTIIQPRMDATPKTHSMPYGELAIWERDVLNPAIKRIEWGHTEENAGPWCRWCIRQNECKAFAERRHESAAAVFDDGVDFD